MASTHQGNNSTDADLFGRGSVDADELERDEKPRDAADFMDSLALLGAATLICATVGFTIYAVFFRAAM